MPAADMLCNSRWLQGAAWRTIRKDMGDSASPRFLMLCANAFSASATCPICTAHEAGGVMGGAKAAASRPAPVEAVWWQPGEAVD